MKDVIIIGAGVVGSLIARKLSAYKLNVLVLEQENDVGNEVSNANSAIIHSGYDPLPGTLKAKLNVEGNKLYDQLAKELDVHFERIGSLTLLTKADDPAILDDLAKRSEANGVPYKILNEKEVKDMEPGVSENVVGALYAPTCGIIDPFNFVAHAMENAVDNGVELHLNETVKDIKTFDDHFEIISDKDKYSCKVLINAAGLFSSIIAKKVNPSFPYEITPHKGEYYVFDNNISLVNHVCFPVPSKLGKGVLVSKTTSNNFIVGPNNVKGKDLSDKSTDPQSLGDIKEKSLKNFASLPFNATVRIFSGIRPTIENYSDFYINYDEKFHNLINLVGIDSPGFASAPAIANYVFEMVNKLIKTEPKDDFNPYIKKYIKVKELSINERNKVIKRDPDYGELVCYCEQVSLGEIKDVLSRSVPVTSIKGIKKRTRAGFGRCQGGFCQPLVANLIAKTYNIPLDKVVYDSNDSYILERLAK
jgi:glycerol-3-phosphate dehydrogenase